MDLKYDNSRLIIYVENKKCRTYVGELKFNKNKKVYIFEYDQNYLESPSAIPLGPELSLFKKVHVSKKLFSSFEDRIPSRKNRAYGDYCKAEGIDINESNPIVLLGTIGKRGPSSFVFERVESRENDFNGNSLKEFRLKLNLSQRDFALAFDFSLPTIQRLEANNSNDVNTLKRAEIYSKFAEVMKYQLNKTKGKLHIKVLSKIERLYE